MDAFCWLDRYPSYALRWLSWLALLPACGSSGATPVVDAGSTAMDARLDDASAEVDAGIDAASEPDAGMRFSMDVPCEGTCEIRWRELEPYDMRLDHHTTFIVERQDGPYLYVLGGVTPNSTGSSVVAYNHRVSAAKIHEDGTIDPWQHQDLGYAFAFHAQAVREGMTPGSTQLVWLGGLGHDVEAASLEPLANPFTFFTTLEPGTGPGIAPIHFGSTGSIARLTAMLSQPVLHGTAVFRPHPTEARGMLLLIGGSRGGSLSADVLSAGESDWIAEAPLPAPRSHHVAVVHAGEVYVLGGFGGSVTDPAGDPTILRSTRDATTGAITGWDMIGTLDEPPWTASAVVDGDALYLVGGGIGGGHHTPAAFLDRVRRARFQADGTLSAFEDVTGPLPIARSHVHQTPRWRNFVYSVGGRSGTAVSVRAESRVFVGTLPPS